MIRIFVLALGAELLTLAQPVPDNADVATLLASPEASRLAWGAYLAGQRQEARHVPLILPLLKHENPDVQMAAADALILLKADVPDELLSAFTADTLDPAIILAAKEPRAHVGFLVRLLQRDLSPEQWAAVHSLNAQSPPAGYAARLLREWEPEIRVRVWHPTEVFVCPPPNAYLQPPRFVWDRGEFPPMVVYLLSLGEASRDEIQLVGGPVPVVYRRVNSERSGGGSLDRRAARGTILYYLAGMEEPRWFGSFRWTGELKYRKDVGSLLEQYRTSLNQLRQTLLQRGLLTEQESKIEPKHRLVIEDQRQVRKMPLPVVEGGE